MIRTLSLMTLMFMVLSSGAGAVPAGEQDRAREEKARLLGVLTCTQLAVHFDEAPAREAIGALSRALAVPIIGRYSDDRIGHGIDGESPITLRLEGVSALLVLEMILEQAAEYEPLTWQLRRGFIEVGTKERLSAPAACEMRTYNVRDLMLEPPYFAAPSGVGFGSGGMPSVRDFDERPYATAVLSKPSESGRKRPEELILELVHGIIETIEPGNWDFGQDDDRIEDEIGNPPPRRGGGSGSRSGDASSPRRHRRPIKIASIRAWRDTIIIRAPDYIHRQVNGYPDPLPPERLTAAQREERQRRAATARSRIIILETTARPPEFEAPSQSHRTAPGAESQDTSR
jgi:hypothetical protein